MYLFVFVGLAWLLTAPAMGVLIGKMVKGADRREHQDALFTFLESDLRGDVRPVPERA
jgi:F0F1-type ATP synthase membrane subunit c/vacuolar-type H+-ATPase subunit K